MAMPHSNTVWASILAFACILFVLGLLLCIPFVLARMRGVNRHVDGLMVSVADWMGADPPSITGKGSKQPAPKDFLQQLKVNKYDKPDDVEAATEDCCAICCCEYEAGQPVITLSCGHLFHKDCIHSWLKVDAVCPICKASLLPQPQQPKAPDCHCGERRRAAVSASTVAPLAGSEAEAQSAQPTAAAAPASPRAVPVSPRAVPASPRAVPMSPRARLPVFHPHALSSPMMGVAGLSP